MRVLGLDIGDSVQMPLKVHEVAEVDKGKGVAQDEGPTMLGHDLLELLQVGRGLLGEVGLLGLLITAEEGSPVPASVNQTILGHIDVVLLANAGAVETWGREEQQSPKADPRRSPE